MGGLLSRRLGLISARAKVARTGSAALAALAALAPAAIPAVATTTLAALGRRIIGSARSAWASHHHPAPTAKAAAILDHHEAHGS